MPAPPQPKSALRARWLAELSLALQEAHRLTERLTQFGPDTPEAVALRNQIQAVRAEVEALQRGTIGASATVSEPPSELAQWRGNWIDLIPPEEDPHPR